MGYSSNVYKKAADRLLERRQKAEKSAEERRSSVYKKLPRTKELEREIASVGPRLARAVIAGGDVQENLKKLRDENLALQTELNEILVSNGYTKDVFEPQYHCKKCNDTGYIEENNRTVVCSCLKQALVACACEELNRYAPLSLSTFDSFNISLYSRTHDSSVGTSPYSQMTHIYNYCKSYAENFKPQYESLFMRGSTGLGKTHLSLAIANEVIKKGYGVIYVSAPSLAKYIESLFRPRDNSDFDLLNMINDCDLLIIDDLGTELTSRFYLSHIYDIFNTRFMLQKPIIINTNLQMSELEKIYSYRIVSRISGGSTKLDFIGQDIRIFKKQSF